MIRTKICELLGIEHPVVLAGMGGVSFSTLTAAVSQAGGMGVLGAAAMEPDFLREEIKRIKSCTDKPFGVDLLMPLPDMLEEQMKVIYDENVPVFVSGLGIPDEIIDEGHKRGMKMLCMIGKVGHALRAKQAGADVIVAQGTEAGGHTGRIGTLALVPQESETDADWPPRWHSVPEASSWEHASSPHPRRERAKHTGTVLSERATKTRM
jgi:enoyl-[acyl-carrier protein] reductase II